MSRSSLSMSLSAIGVAAVFALSGCAGASPDTATDEPDAPAAEETQASEAETACPAGFVEAYEAASIANFAEGATFTEVSAADFQPAFLAQFLDGGCAVHVTGTATFNGMEIPVDTDYGFAPADLSADIAAALEAEGYVDDGTGFNFAKADGSAYAQVIVPTDDFHTNGDAAVQQFYKNGTVFNAG